MKAIILAGGEGTRLRPITYEIPKPLIPVKKKPIISHILDFIETYKIIDVAIIINKAHIADFEIWKEIWQKKLSIKPSFFVEEKPAGTFACMRLVKDWIGEDDFIVFNGDSLIDFDLQSLIDCHQSHRQIGTVGLIQSSTSGDYGVPVLTEANHISRFDRRVVKPASDFVCFGCYIFRPQIFMYDELDQPFLLIEKDIFPKLIENEVLVAMQINKGRFYECGSLESWEDAIMEW